MCLCVCVYGASHLVLLEYLCLQFCNQLEKCLLMMNDVCEVVWVAQDGSLHSLDASREKSEPDY